MNYFIFAAAFSGMPKAMMVTITISVLAVLLLAGFVLYMWKTQEKSAYIAKEVNKITDSIGAGVLNFIASGDGRITYANKGFYEIVGYSKQELKDKYGFCFYNMLTDSFAERMRGTDVDDEYSISEEMQIQCASGIKWVLLKGNAVKRKGQIITISAVMVDITENKLLNQRLSLEQQRYRLATELSNDVIMTYSISDDSLNISDNFREFYGGETSIPNFAANRTWENGYIYKDDIEKVAELVRIVSGKGGGIDQQIRVKDKNDNYLWCRLICMPVPTDNNDSKEYIGKLINIDMHKKQLSLLEKKASRDPLTGAFNKEYTKALVNRYIAENEGVPGMLFMVDIDRFKSINDTYGHAVGDGIIVEVVRQVTKAFRSNDIVGRIGGDEFAVFVCNVRNPEDQIKQAQKLHEVLRMPVDIDGQTINKSASIGIALYPQHADSYEKLIECADRALYKVKGSGRDSFIMYEEE